MTRTIHCGSCGGSGFRAGTYGDIECIDCSGEGSWEPADEETISSVTLADCRRLYGCLEAPPLDQLTEVIPPPFRAMRFQRRSAALRAEPSFTVSAVPAAAAIARRKR